MKILKKAGAVLLALAMIVVMIPQLGSKVVKAATPSQTDVWTAKANGTNAVGVISPHVSSSFTFTNTKKMLDPDDNSVYGQALKTGSTSYFDIIVPAGKYVKVTVVAVSNKATSGCVKLGTNISDPIEPYNSADNVVAKKITMTGYLTEGTTILTHDTAQILILKVTAEVYDNVSDVPPDPEVTKVKVSGTVTSSISLAEGKIYFGKEESNLTLKEGTTDKYTYEFAEIKGDGAEHMVKIIAPEVTKSLKNIDSTSFGADGKVQVEGAEDKVVDFTLKFTDLDGLVWDFTDTTKNWQFITYENNGTNPPSGTYKGLVVDATTNKAKFDVQSGRVQINENTKVKIPVSGWGNVTCTFTGKPTNVTTLGETTGDGAATTITYNYKNAEYVELSIGVGNTGLYLTKIKVTPDTNPAVKTLGASVRQETADWGNGIRFGGQLDLTKVDKATCTSGTLIGLASTVGNGNEMTLEDEGKTCINVVRKTCITETDAALEYAAALINIPEANLDTTIVARPYVTVNETTYYGEQIETTYNSATKIVNEQ